VHLESKKLGLFRIGPMLQLVIEDMAILLLPDINFVASAAALDAFFNANPIWSDISIRGFELRQMQSHARFFKADSARIDTSKGKKSSSKNSLPSRQSVTKYLFRVPFCVSVETWLAKSSASEAAPTTA